MPSGLSSENGQLPGGLGDCEGLATDFCELAGAIVGDEVALPAGTVLSPGTLIGPGTVVYPRNHIGGFLPAGSRVR
ncbi:hypothetical protein [Streptomyces sp. NPDC086182]|jgi:hypothetical protein|uniref:hypothetical protein n=1 Tax=Streptomyces sp. NPDC086182 TaxID=3155058 RepID=UPI003429EEA4